MSERQNPILTHISVENFKNLRQVELDLQPLNVLIGPNGSGKSNFLSLFKMLSMGGDERLPEFIRQQGGINDVLWHDLNNTTDLLNIELTFQNLKEVNTNRKDEQTSYKLEIARKGHAYSVIAEKIFHPPDQSETYPYTYILTRDGNVRFIRSLGDSYEDDLKPYNDVQNLIFTQIRDRKNYPLLDEIRLTFKDWIIFRGFGENALENIHRSQPIEAINPLRLDPKGKNLVSVLHILMNEYDSEFLEDVLRVAFPDFKKLSFQIPPGSPEMALYWRTLTNQYPSYALSDGMIRFLGLATLLLLPHPPSLITIDEPEIGLHPKLIPLLARLLKIAAQKTQVIVATHSPQLLEYLDLEDVILADRDGGGVAQFGKPSREQLASWLEDFTLGNLWTMGKLRIEA